MRKVTKVQKTPPTLFWEKCHNGAFAVSNQHHYDFSPDQKWSTFVTFLFFLKSAPIWLFYRTKLRHHYDFSHFLGPKLQRQFLGWKNALIPQLIDSDDRALHNDSESGPNSKITKITNMTFLQTTADLWLAHAKNEKSILLGKIALFVSLNLWLLS